MSSQLFDIQFVTYLIIWNGPQYSSMNVRQSDGVVLLFIIRKVQSYLCFHMLITNDLRMIDRQATRKVLCTSYLATTPLCINRSSFLKNPQFFLSRSRFMYSNSVAPSHVNMWVGLITEFSIEYFCNAVAQKWMYSLHLL